MFCAAFDVYLDLAAFPSPAQYRSNTTAHGFTGNVEEGITATHSMTAACAWEQRASLSPTHPMMLFRNPCSSTRPDPSTIIGSLTGTTIMLNRDLPLNPYHAFSDVFGAWLSLMVIGAESTDTQVIFGESSPSSVLTPLWNLVAQKGSLRPGESLPNKGFVHVPILLLPLPGRQTPFMQDFWKPNDCGWSPLFAGFRRLLLGIGNVTPHPDVPSLPRVPTQPKAWSSRRIEMPPFQVTVIQRRFFHEKAFRTIGNEEELLSAIKSWHPSAKVVVVETGDLTLAEQANLMRETSVCIGVHGAGLTNILFLPEFAAVVELRPGNIIRGNCYRNIAKWSGLGYFHWSQEEHEYDQLKAMVLPVVDIKGIIDAAIRYAQERRI